MVISGWDDENGGSYFNPFSDTFDYDPETEEFYFTGNEFTFDDLDCYYMKARMIDETTIEIRRLQGNRASGPIEDPRYQNPERYTLQYLTAGSNYASVNGYAFVDAHGDFNIVLTAPLSAIYAFHNFLNAGNSPEAITEPPRGRTLVRHRMLKHPELYREPTLTVVEMN